MSEGNEGLSRSASGNGNGIGEHPAARSSKELRQVRPQRAEGSLVGAFVLSRRCVEQRDSPLRGFMPAPKELLEKVSELFSGTRRISSAQFHSELLAVLDEAEAFKPQVDAAQEEALARALKNIKGVIAVGWCSHEDSWLRHARRDVEGNSFPIAGAEVDPFTGLLISVERGQRGRVLPGRPDRWHLLEMVARYWQAVARAAEVSARRAQTSSSGAPGSAP